MDEADMLLELGFERAMGRLLEQLPKSRVTALFSATQTKEVRALAMAGMLDPVAVRVRVAAPKQAAAGEQKRGSAPLDSAQASSSSGSSASATTSSAPSSAMATGSMRLPTRLACYSVRCPAASKMGALVSLLRRCFAVSTTSGSTAQASGSTSRAPKLIVFALTCATVEYLARVLAAPVYAQDLQGLSEALRRTASGRAVMSGAAQSASSSSSGASGTGSPAAAHAPTAV